MSKTDIYGRNALILAGMKNGTDAIVYRLIQDGIEIEKKRTGGNNAISMAASYGNLPVVQVGQKICSLERDWRLLNSLVLVRVVNPI